MCASISNNVNGIGVLFSKPHHGLLEVYLLCLENVRFFPFIPKTRRLPEDVAGVPGRTQVVDLSDEDCCVLD